MKIESRIHFYRNGVSVQMEPLESIQDSAKEYIELSLFACFTLRLAQNLGKNSSPLIQMLKDSAFAFGQNVDDFLALTTSKDHDRLVDYRGIVGDKYFDFFIEYTSPQDRRIINFQFKAKGFGFFARNIDMYAQAAVLMFLRYLILNNKEKPEYVNSAAKIAIGCSTFINSDYSSKMNEIQVVNMVLDSIYGN